jgi:hypothetical protein
VACYRMSLPSQEGLLHGTSQSVHTLLHGTSRSVYIQLHGTSRSVYTLLHGTSQSVYTLLHGTSQSVYLSRPKPTIQSILSAMCLRPYAMQIPPLFYLDSLTVCTSRRLTNTQLPRSVAAGNQRNTWTRSYQLQTNTQHSTLNPAYVTASRIKSIAACVFTVRYAITRPGPDLSQLIRVTNISLLLR